MLIFYMLFYPNVSVHERQSGVNKGIYVSGGLVYRAPPTPGVDPNRKNRLSQTSLPKDIKYYGKQSKIVNKIFQFCTKKYKNN